MLRRHWLAALLFAALALVLTNPLVFHTWNAVEDKQDALLNTWIMAWIGHAAITDPLNLYNANIFWPYSNALAFSELLIPQGLLALPITLATDNQIFGYNVLLLAMLWLDAFAMYLLVLDWTGRLEAGWVAGVVYSFNPFNLGNLAQVQLLALGWLPLALLYLSRLLRADRRGLMPRELFLFALFFVLQALSSIYYALIGGIALAVYLAYRALRGAAPRLHVSASPRLLISASPGLPIARLLLASLLALAVLTPFLIPYFSVQRELGFQRKVEESEPFSASLKQFAEVSPENLVYGRWLAPNPVHFEGGYPLDNLFPGVFAVVLAVVALTSGKMANRWFLLALGVIAFLLALGPRLYLVPGDGTEITLPYRWLYDLFPPLRGLRAPVRFDALIMFAIAGLAGIGVIVGLPARDRTNPKGREELSGLGRRLIPLGWVVLIAIEYISLPAANTATMPVAGEIAPVYRFLATQPPGPVLELPMMGPNANGQLDLSRQYFSAYHWHPTPDGYSGFIPPGRGAIAYEMGFFPSPRAVAVLQTLQVKYLVLHWDALTATQRSIDPSEEEELTRLSPIFESDEAEVYSVATLSQNPTQLKVSLYVPQPVRAGSLFTAYVILRNQISFPYANGPMDKASWEARWSSGDIQSAESNLPLVTSSVSVVPVQLRAPEREGKWDFELTTDRAPDGPLGRVDLRQKVQVSGERADEIVLPARIETAAPLEVSYSAGATVSVDLNWLPYDKIDAYYSASVRLVNDQGEKILNVDREPSTPTLLWIPDSIVRDHFELPLPAGLPKGNYRIDVMLYDAHSEASVLLLDQNDRPREVFTAGEIQIK